MRLNLVGIVLFLFVLVCIGGCKVINAQSICSDNCISLQAIEVNDGVETIRIQADQTVIPLWYSIVYIYTDRDWLNQTQTVSGYPKLISYDTNTRVLTYEINPGTPDQQNCTVYSYYPEIREPVCTGIQKEG